MILTPTPKRPKYFDWPIRDPKRNWAYPHLASHGTWSITGLKPNQMTFIHLWRRFLNLRIDLNFRSLLFTHFYCPILCIIWQRDKALLIEIIESPRTLPDEWWHFREYQPNDRTLCGVLFIFLLPSFNGPKSFPFIFLECFDHIGHSVNSFV